MLVLANSKKKYISFFQILLLFIEQQKNTQNIRSYDLLHEKILLLLNCTSLGYLIKYCQGQVFIFSLLFFLHILE